MTNPAHWQDDIDDALGGDFDGSLSGLRIMSLSFDFSRTGSGPHLTTTNASISGNNNQRTSTGLFGSSSAPVKLSTCSSGGSAEREGQANSNGCFKRFKPSISDIDNNQEDTQNKIARQLQQIKNCLTSSSINITNTVAAHSSNNPQINQNHDNESNVNDESRQASENPSSAASSRAQSPTNDSSADTSTVGARSPSPTHSCSSALSHSQGSSRSQSPQDPSGHECNNTTLVVNSIANNINEPKNNTANNNINNIKLHINETRSDNQVSLYSLKDNIYGGSTLKEASFTTSVFTTTAPMHFKSIHHPFPIKQFPLSPYHQMSNSSFNPDLYDRYISLDGHQPLQTPLIAIERTQDLSSLKLPPHGPEELDIHRFTKDWPFEDTKQDTVQVRSGNNDADKNKSNTTEGNVRLSSEKQKESADNVSNGQQKGFPFNYKGSSNSSKENKITDQHEPMDLNVSYEQDDCSEDQGAKNNMFLESMKHFNPNHAQQSSCFSIQKAKNSPHNLTNNTHKNDEEENGNNIAQQHLGQESMFGIDPSKQKFHYVLAAPISVATKLNEDTMTYLNQAQAYEIKLENRTDVSEAKKGFMCSIINIGFQERHMQQAENELWQQWSQQHPNEKIFSVDMKLSYNVFGVESDGLNKYEFLWDSSKAAGVFIRINSISTEFTPKKHGGEKGVPFKLSIETFSYNSKTHDSYFISASCCQIKVFKPKGAERKIRSDREKISKRPANEQEKYHRSCDHTSFKECSLTSLHPMADGSLCYYRHSHGHFASKQVITTNSATGTASSVAIPQATTIQSDDEHDHSPRNDSSVDQNQNHPSQQLNNDSETSSNGHINNHQRDFAAQNAKHLVNKNHQSDCTANRLISRNSQFPRGNLDNQEQTDRSYGNAQNQNPTPESNLSHHHGHPQNHLSGEHIQTQQSTIFNQVYSSNNHLNRSVAGLTGLNHGPQHFSMPYYAHTLPTSIASHIPPPAPSFGPPMSSSLISPAHNLPIPIQQQSAIKTGPPTVYRPLSLDKQNPVGAINHQASFKPTNLGLNSHNSSFQTYFGNHLDLCNDGPPQDLKDNSVNHGNYQHENYEHPHPASQSTSSQGQSIRHRSASITTTTNCASYNSGMHNSIHQNRHIEGYISGSGLSIPDANNMPTNSWFHGSNNHSTHITSPGTVCAQKSNQMTALNQDTHHYGTGQAFDCNEQSFALDDSPQKTHGSDLSSSCHSRFKNNSSIVSCNSLVSHDVTKISNQPIRQITVTSTCTEVLSWFTANRFGLYTKTFGNFSGSDLLRLSKSDLIEICGFIDGIRLFNSLHNQPIKPKRILYVCHQTSDIFHPIYLYDVSLKELLRELSKVFNSYMQHADSKFFDEKQPKSIGEKLALNSGSSTDSRSSIGALSTEAGNEEAYGQGENFFNDMDVLRLEKCRSSEYKVSSDSEYSRQLAAIDRLLIDGLTSVKIVATEQVVQILENESVWKLNLIMGNPGIIEACMSACSSKRISK